MFESAILGHTIDKETFKVEELKLRPALLEAQEMLRENGTFPVIILISGVDGSGKGDTINTLYEWMDPRYMSTRTFSAPRRKSDSVRRCGVSGERYRRKGESGLRPVRGIRGRLPIALLVTFRDPILASAWMS